MKKVIGIFMLASMIVFGSMAISYAAKGDKQKAEQYGFLSVAAALAPAPASSVLGLSGRNYFSPNTGEVYDRAELELLNFLKDPKNRKEQTLSDLDAGNLILDTYTGSFRFIIPISITGRRELLNAASTYFQGRIPEEINQGMLPQGFNIAVSHIQCGFATDAAITVPEGDVDYGSISDSWPAALRNSQLVFSQSGTIKKKIDTVMCGTKAASQFNNGEISAFELRSPFILEETKVNKWEIITPQAVAFPATPANLFLEIILFGACTRLKY